jgi:hypothetical protein
LRIHKTFEPESLKIEDKFGDLGVGGKIILKCISKKIIWDRRLDSYDSGQTLQAGCC